MFKITFEEIIAQENLLLAWREFRRGKRRAKDVCEFERNLADNLVGLENDLASGAYRHGGYYRFRINDPKPRVIHKASVRDRLVHHAIHRKLYPLLDKIFITDSYSCRMGKGTHRAMNKFKEYGHRLGQNNTRTTWVLKGDVRRFFDNIDHGILKELLSKYVLDEKVLELLDNVIDSFRIPGQVRNDKSSGAMCKRNTTGLPLGNLTSQLLVNVYMNEFDQFVKYKLGLRYYIRYADDFVVLSENREWLESLISPIRQFLNARLGLELHPDKLFIKTVASGVDFLGWVSFSDYRVLRSVARRRMLRTILAKPEAAVFESYKGLLKHGKTYGLQGKVDNLRGLVLDWA
ncbi:MAG: hypothetical protein COU10_01025 [Candidatus Harrisonbacteria bacterium CG10_big_fil_rev_8_21_14_0_10_45_28]|uniref:Reverse transcriptase domain-containing protein n=1 Tax=Candidatus Harrisonbacteria bacterium CG10_big_fil_rev_8_21_14_0_10_45_28 TaxID=1974586 RepID=A0A2H0UNS6_9BACT|nr:MAG: hypothetical protein COU10_01025 [Candidatus Harrisonbacteria bacterium CG10_big_fil_rev_8_21_14_0_10_45_28]